MSVKMWHLRNTRLLIKSGAVKFDTWILFISKGWHGIQALYSRINASMVTLAPFPFRYCVVERQYMFKIIKERIQVKFLSSKGDY